ncbi:MAG: histidine phosphatase family protein [Clostridia bacterium]|nr:histidine phosphatase family protein [Clostridia bacterium]
MKLYAIRHGETMANSKGIYNGTLNEDINETGIKQAEETRQLMKDKEYDIIYCSPMIRAKHTCQIINEKDIPVIYDERLKERSLGKLDGKEIDRKGKDKELFYNYNYKSNDETFEDLPTLFKRVHSFLDEIIKKNKDKNILIVAHGGISRAIYFYFNEIPEDGDLSVYVPKNCEINTYEI